MAAGACSIENTICKQWIAVFVACEPCSIRNADAVVRRNRFIAPIGRAAPPPFELRRKRLRGAAQ
jgi:hypothetical protein